MVNYNITLVVLSFAIAVTGSLMALIMTRDALLRPSDKRKWLIGLASLCLGGVAIWSMHFIGMQALDMPDMDTNYNGWLTVLSFVVGVGVVYVGLTYMTIGEYKYLKLIVSGVVVGLGVVAMHYSGMLSMQIQADIQWNWFLVAVSIIIAVVAATAALWLAVHVQHYWQMALSAVIMGIAVCGMHYTGMAAVTFIHNPNLPVVQSMSVTSSVFSLSVLTIDTLVIVLALAQALSEANQRKVSSI